MSANNKQVAGTHYANPTGGSQHWDMVVEHQLNYFEGQATKYIMRCRKKNGKQDIQKAIHFLEKYLEVWEKIQPSSPTADSFTKAHVARAQDQNDDWQCEGYYGDNTQLYRCRHCRALVRSRTLQDVSDNHRCTLAPGAAAAGPEYVNQGE
jgi:hypothetical protein